MDKQIRRIEGLAAEAEQDDMSAETKRWEVARLTAEYVEQEGISAREYDRRAGVPSDTASGRIRAWRRHGAEALGTRPRFWSVAMAQTTDRNERALGTVTRREPEKVIAKAAEILRDRPELGNDLIRTAWIGSPGIARDLALTEPSAFLAMKAAVEEAAETPDSRELRRRGAEESRLRGQEFVRPIRQITATTMLLDAARELAKMLRDVKESGARITREQKADLKGLLAQMADDLELIEFMQQEVQS